MPKKINVLFDANPLVKRKTGVGYYVENTIKALAANYTDEITLTGYYFDFLGRGQEPPKITGVSYKPIRWIPHALRAALWRVRIQLPLSLLIPSASKYDVVMFGDFVGPPSSRIKRISTVHDLCYLDHPEYVSKANSKFLKRFMPASIKSADMVITVSSIIKDRIIKTFGVNENKIRVASPGSNVELPPTVAKKNDFVLFTGTIEPRKNLVNLLRAYAQLPESLQKKYPLKLAGGKGWNDESILREVEKLQKEGLEIELLGYVSQTTKASLYKTAAVVTLVSFDEGFGMQILEAMQAGKPLLLSDIPVFHEIAGSSAFYCDPSSPNNIASNLERLLTQKKKFEPKKYQAILEKYTWENSAKNIYKAILEVAK
jgi:glycosyltransferase involved in cell wall biosynthesis